MKQLIATLVVSVLLSNTSHGQTDFPLETPCNPISLFTCALPYPSDVYSKADPTSPTGVRFEYPEGVVRPELLTEVPPTLYPEKVFSDATGYSAATSVLFELDSAPDLTTLPADGGDSVIALNLDTSERVPVRAAINEYARSGLVSAPSQIVEIFPRSRWQFAGRYAVFLTRNLKTAYGEDYNPSSGFAQAISQDGSTLSAFYEPIIERLEALGYSRDQLISATFFTVRDEEEVTGKLKTLTEYVYNQEHPVRNIRIRHKIFGYIGAFVSGEIRMTNFRDQYGGMVYDVNQAEENWVPFRLALPRVAKKGSVPVAISGHGLGMFKELEFRPAISNAKMGIATIAIDHPNHGVRSVEDGGFILFSLAPRFVPQQVGMMVQSSVDHMALLKAIQTSIGELDILPKRFWGPLFTTNMRGGDGIPDLDTSRIFYQGTSLGGVLGSAFISLAPDLKGAFLRISGVGVTSILAGSSLWDPLFSRLEPPEATGAEALLLKAAMQHELDYGDGINFVHYLRNPTGIATAKPVAVVAGYQDGVVPNFSSVAFAEIAGLPSVGTEYFPVPGVPKLDTFDQGYGLYQANPDPQTNNEIIRGLMIHFSTGGGGIEDEWIEQYILNQ